MAPRWTEAEVMQLGDLIGDFPWSLVVSHYNRWAQSEGYPVRTCGALRTKAESCRMGSRVATGQWLRLGTIRELLGVSYPCSARWIAKGLAVRLEGKGTRKGRCFYVHREALKKFAKNHPQYFAGLSRRTLTILFDPGSPLVERYSSMPRLPKHGKERPLMAIESGRVYRCAEDAAQELHTNASNIRRAIYKGTRARGYHFKYIDPWALHQEQSSIAA